MEKNTVIDILNKMSPWTVSDFSNEEIEMTSLQQIDLSRRDQFLKDIKAGKMPLQADGVTPVEGFKPIYEPYQIFAELPFNFIRYGSVDTSDNDVISFLIDDDTMLSGGPAVNRNNRRWEDIIDERIKGQVVCRVYVSYDVISSISSPKVLIPKEYQTGGLQWHF